MGAVHGSSLVRVSCLRAQAPAGLLFWDVSGRVICCKGCCELCRVQMRPQALGIGACPLVSAQPFVMCALCSSTHLASSSWLC